MSKEKVRWPEPEITRNKHIPTKEYGLLKVFEWPDGTVIHINTRKGEENLRVHHASGSYDEYTSNGVRLNMSSNNSVSYSKGGVTLTYDGNSDTKGPGHARLSLDHDAHIEVKKSASIAVAGTAEVVSVGHVKVAATDLYLGTTKGSIVLNSARDIEIKAAGRVLAHADQAVQITSKSGDVHVEAGDDTIVKSKGKTEITAGSNVKLEAKGEKNEILSGKDVVTYGKTSTKVQKGGAAAPPTTFV